MDIPLTNSEIEFMEFYYDPTAMTENLIPMRENSPQMWNSTISCLTLRNYQFAMQNYSYMLADDPDLHKDLELNKKANIRLKKLVGDLFSIGSRNTGKSLFLKIDTVLSYIYGLSLITVASFDDYHLEKITKPIADYIELHPFLKIFTLRDTKKGSVKRTPLTAISQHGSTIESANENVKGKNPGEQFHAKHWDAIFYEEFCVDGKTQIRWVDKEGKIHSGTIAKFINQGYWKENLVYSYNFEKQKIELKPVTNIFQKQVKNYGYWDLKFENYGNTEYRRLVTSQHQKIWTKDGYKKVEDITKNDEFYTYDYYKLTELQKEILVGTLLGDSCLSQKEKGKCHPCLSFNHGKNQQEYFFYKKSCFKNLFRSFHRYKFSKQYNEQFTEYGGHIFHTVSDTCLDFYEFLNFKKSTLNKEILKKYLTDVSLAFWLMDDGMLLGNKGKTDKAKYIVLHTEGFDEESHQILQEILKSKFELDSEIISYNRFGKKYNQIKFDNKNTIKFIDIVKKYIHPTLYYKIYTKTELCRFIYKNEMPLFDDLSENVKDILQPIKLLSKEFKIQKSWKMHDIEVEDNHNFFAGGTLISNSYASDEGEKKRVDSGNSLGYIERPSGIPDLCIGSPLGKILNDPKKKPWIWRLPQFVRSDFDEYTMKELSDKYSGERSTAFKLNVLAETIEGAFGFWDMERLREASIKENKRIKSFEIDKDNFHKFEENLIIERLPGAKQCFVCADIGKGSAPTEIIIIFYDGNKYKYIYNISLYRLIPDEQAKIFAWLYEKLGGAFIAVDATGDGESVGSPTVNCLKNNYNIPLEHLLDVFLGSNIEVDLERDENGNPIMDRNGNPIMKEENTREWAFKELERLMYGNLMEIPYDEKFIVQFTTTIAKQTKGNKVIYDNKGDDHLHQAFEIWAICRFFNDEFKTMKNQNRKKICWGVVNIGDKNGN